MDPKPNQPQNQPQSPGPGRAVQPQVVQIDEESVQKLSQVEMSIVQWNGKYMALALEMRGIESTVFTLQKHKEQLMEDALKKIGMDIGQFEVAQVAPGGRAVLIPRRTPPGPNGSQPRPGPEPGPDEDPPPEPGPDEGAPKA